MKIIKLTVCMVFMASVANAMTVYYDSETLDVACWGYQDSEAYLKLNPNLKIVYVKDDDEILTNPTSYLKYNKTTKKIALKTAEQINTIKNELKKQQIRTEIRVLKRREMEALSDGYDVSIETASIRQKVETLKQEYDLIP